MRGSRGSIRGWMSGVDLGEEWGLDLDLLGHFASGIDPVALEGAKDSPEAAFLCFEAAPRASIISPWPAVPLRCM